ASIAYAEPHTDAELYAWAERNGLPAREAPEPVPVVGGSLTARPSCQRSRRRLAMLASKVHVAVQPITPTVGAKVGDIDLAAPLTDELVASLRTLLLIHGMLVFRGQGGMTREHHLALARAFGPLERSPIGEASHPDVVRIVHDTDAPPTEN